MDLMFGLPFHYKDGQIQLSYVVLSPWCVMCMNTEDVTSVSLEQFKIDKLTCYCICDLVLPNI